MRPRRAIEAARSSIDMPAFTRRTLDWLSTSLLKGMSRDDDRVIFCTAVAIGIFLRNGRPKDSLSTSNPSRNPRPSSPSLLPALACSTAAAEMIVRFRIRLALFKNDYNSRPDSRVVGEDDRLETMTSRHGRGS